jgi:hypothetical protein
MHVMANTRRIIVNFKATLFALSTVCLITLVIGSPNAHAASGGGYGPGGPFGLGIVIGEPTGLTAKYRMNSEQAFDIGLSFDVSHWFLIYSDWLYHFPGGFGNKAPFFQQTTPYIGIGGLLIFSNRDEWETRHWRYYSTTSSSRTAVGVRIPLGAEWRAPSIPLGVFVELVPGLVIVPATDGFFQAGIGARFYF